MRLRNKYIWQAFEVEDIRRRENYTFEYNPYDQTVNMYDTSKNIGKKLKMIYKKDFPSECETAYDYFTYLYEKSTKFESDNDIYFLGWVHPVSIIPLSEMKKVKLKNEIDNYDEIKRKLREKHKSFCKSISDFKLRKIFRKHAYFAGGVIASLIRGESPKDYDYFFDNKEVLEKVIKYYVENHNTRYEGTNIDYKISVNSSDEKVLISLNKPYVPSDEENNTQMNPVIFSDRAISFPNGYQLIIDCDNAEGKSVDRFDFIHTMGYFHPYQNKLFAKEETLAAIKDHKLIYNKQGTNPIGTAKRLLRFIERGWEIDNKEHMKILININQVQSETSFDREGENYIF